MVEVEGHKLLSFVDRKEKPGSQVGFVLIRGMEDLPDSISGVIAKGLNTEAFNSRWKNNESLDKKVERLEEMVDNIRDQGKQVVLLGVSAGAGLAMVYTLRYPDKVRHIYSFSGLLDPDLNKMNLEHLTSTSSSFKEMAEELTDRLTPETRERLHLSEKVTAYASYVNKDFKGDFPLTADGRKLPNDGIVPLVASQPEWVKRVNVKSVGKASHAIGIAKALFDVKKDLRIVEKAKFD